MRTFKWITIRDERQFRAFTGLSQKEFDRLLAEFTQSLESAQQQRYKKHSLQRQRKPGGGRKGALSTPELKLFFILFYSSPIPVVEFLNTNLLFQN